MLPKIEKRGKGEDSRSGEHNVSRPQTHAAMSSMSRIAKREGPFDVVEIEGGSVEMLYQNRMLEYC